jgi:hypothetical protein
MYWHTFSLLTGGAVFVGMLASFKLGRIGGGRWKTAEESQVQAGLGAIDGAVLALLGLLIAFTFAGAATRLDFRRQLIVEEANCVGTAWLRIDLLPAPAQPKIRDHFRRYVDARLDAYAKLPDREATMVGLKRCAELQNQIWADGVAACAESASPQAAMLVLPALNQMIDVTTTRTATALMHPPSIIFAILILVALASALLTGHAMAGPKKPSRLHVIGFAAAISVTIAVIVDLEYPRAGFIRENAADQVLIDLRASMG